MSRALSWTIVAASFLGGVFLPDLVAKAAVPERKPVSSVAVQETPADGAPEAPGLAPGVAVREGADGRYRPDDVERITPLDAQDPSALVMPPLAGALPSCAEKPCDCAQDSLHRYEPKKRKKAEFESLRGKKAAPRAGTAQPAPPAD